MGQARKRHVPQGAGNNRPVPSRRAPLAVMAALVALASCRAGKPMERRTVTADGRPIACAGIARTRGQQHRGLSGIDSLAPGAGMAFIFDHERPSFWMKDTRFDLLIVWVDGARIIGIDLMPAQSLTLFKPPAPITMAVELEASTVVAGATSLMLAGRCKG